MQVDATVWCGCNFQVVAYTRDGLACFVCSDT